MKRIACAVVCAALAACLSGATALAQVNERAIYAGVVTSNGEPVLGLTTKDFIVREDGVAREVLRVEKDEDPLQVALLVDNSIVMRNKVMDVRRAVEAFFESLRPGIQVALITMAERPTIIVPYTADHAALTAGVGRIFALEAGNTLLDAIAEAAQGLSLRTSARSVIAVVTGRGPELSYREYTNVLRIVRESGRPALHAIVVDSAEFEPASSFDVEPAFSGDSQERKDGIGREMVLGLVTKETGGRYEQVLSVSALSMKLQQMSTELSNQYRVVFASPARLVPAKNTVISARDPTLKARGMVVTDTKN